jgi:DNA-binding response OmpR family regulator
VGESGDRLGDALQQAGILDGAAIKDALKEQKRTWPLASMAYLLGHAGEASLVRGLAWQAGLPGIVFEGSKIDLGLLESFEDSWLSHHMILPVLREGRRLHLAVSDPKQVARLARQIEFDHDVSLVIHVALQVVLARAIRDCIAARKRGERYLIGASAHPSQQGPEIVVATMLKPEDEKRVAGPAGRRHETSDSEFDELSSLTTGVAASADDEFEEQTMLRNKTSQVASRYDRSETQLDLDASMELKKGQAGAKRILIVEDDLRLRAQLVNIFDKQGYELVMSAGGKGTLDVIRATALSAVILDGANPNIDGFRICRAIKRSRRYRHLPVILMSGLDGSSDVGLKAVQQYGADAYFPKPVNLVKLTARLEELIRDVEQETDELTIGQDTFEGAMESFRAGRVEEAIEGLRLGIEDDPLSPRHHFLLANLLHGQGESYEAMDEYETVVNLCPDYFPALTRLAYLYYEKGYSAKAIDTWRRALPHCDDLAMRASIEGFMGKLVSGILKE